MPLALLLLVAVLLCTPLMAAVANAPELRTVLDRGRLEDLESDMGYVALYLTLVALLPSVAPRRIGWLSSLRRSRPLHIAAGTAILAATVIHTGGSWGNNLNLALLGSLLASVFIALVGKLVENRSIVRNPVVSAKIRALWLPAHLIAVSCFVVLLLFHVLSVYYF